MQERALLPRDVDARLDMWGHLLADGRLLVPCAGAHLMNHSCAANVLDFGLDFGLAVRDIAAGEEVTCDYGAFFADEGWTMRCHCGATECRSDVASSDYDDPALRKGWVGLVSAALPATRVVDQPLGPLLASQSEVYRRVVAGASTVDDAANGDSIVQPGFLT